MSMSITGCGASPPQMPRGGRMDVSSMVEQAFSKIDTKGQGYIDEAELESALGQATGPQSTTNSTATDVMKALDSDGDGKLTKDEMTSGLEKLASALDQQFATMRTKGEGSHGMHGHRPPADATNASSSDRGDDMASQDAAAASRPKHGHHHGHADALGQIVRLVEASSGSSAAQQTSTLSVTA